MQIEIRKITESDNETLARIIRNTLIEFDAAKPGTVFYDESTDHLSDLFSRANSVYYVALINGELMGGAGLYPTNGLPEDTVELVKIYLRPQARGFGVGKALILKCLDTALALGYSRVYLETMAELAAAVQTYLHLGFSSLTAPMGNSGHHSCDIWMSKDLQA
jgi:putative acetyltransferase